MKVEKIDKVNKLWDSYNKLGDLRQIIDSSNCRIFKKKDLKRIGFDNYSYWNFWKSISLYSLDETTVKRLRYALFDVIDERQAEIKKEIEEI